MALTKVTDSIIDFDTLTIAGTQAADTTYLKLQNTPATAATHKVAMEFWGNEGTANGSTFNMGRIYGEFDGSSYSTTRLTLGSASGNGTFNDEINIKNGRVGINSSSPAYQLDVSGSVRSNGGYYTEGNTSGGFLWGIDNYPLRFGTNNTERMRLDGSGNFYVNRTVSGFNNDGLLVGTSGGAYIYLERSVAGNSVLYVHRRSSDGNLVDFYQGNTLEGSISVSGTTVSYNGFCGTHDSSGTGVSSSTQVGTILSTIDAEHKTDHAKVKVSDTEGDVRVYGVLQEYKEEETNDDTGNTSAEHAVVASVGIGSVLVTGACNGGDLLESNGDGTAKVQSDDIIRSKTIGKVTIGNSDTGVKLVSCVLYCG